MSKPISSSSQDQPPYGQHDGCKYKATEDRHRIDREGTNDNQHHTDARLKSLALGNLIIHFRKTAPSKLFWAGRPAMRVVQALHWLRDTLQSDASRVRKRLQSIFTDPLHSSAITADLRHGLFTLPTWMQFFLRDLIK